MAADESVTKFLWLQTRTGTEMTIRINLLVGCAELKWGLNLCESLHAAQPGSFQYAVSTMEGVVREAAALQPDVILLERPARQAKT